MTDDHGPRRATRSPVNQDPVGWSTRALKPRRHDHVKYMDVHSGFFNVTAEQLNEAHGRDLAVEGDEGVHFERAWLDPEAGKVFCLATGPSKEAVLRVHQRAGHPTEEIYELPIEV
jgi:hypothetical protein